MFPKQKSRIILAGFTAILAAVWMTSLVQAGGWAVVTLDRIPGNIITGQPYALGFMVRQHGRTPWQVDQILIQASQPETGRSLTFTAKPDAVPGHYQVVLLFPQPGTWEWSIQSGLYPQEQPMPALEVANAAAPAGKSAVETTSRAMSLSGRLLGGMALLSLAGGVVLLALSRAKRLRALAGAGLIILCGGLAFAFFSSVNAAARPSPPAAETSAHVENGSGTGQELFLAKGCLVCHTNNRAIKNTEQYSMNIGPNLSKYHNDPAYLRKWLTDPNAVKPGTGMPALGLSPAEIDALISFLNAGGN